MKLCTVETAIEITNDYIFSPLLLYQTLTAQIPVQALALQTHNSAPKRSRHRTVHSASFAFRLLCIRSIHNGITFIARKGNEPA